MRRYTAIGLTVLTSIQPALSQPGKESLSLSPLPAVVSPRTIPARTYQYKRTAVRSAVQRTYPSTHFQRGMYFKQKGDLNSALVEFLKATQENPQLVKAFYEQALIFHERGYLKLAESSLERGLAVDPQNQQVRLLLATVQLQQGNIGDAVKELSRSLGLSQQKVMPPAAAPPQEQPAESQAVPPTIQLPHGELQPPPPPPEPAEMEQAPSSPPQFETPAPVTTETGDPDSDIDDILKGIPGIDPAVPDGSSAPSTSRDRSASTGSSESPTAIRTQRIDTPVSESPDTVSKSEQRQIEEALAKVRLENKSPLMNFGLLSWLGRAKPQLPRPSFNPPAPKPKKEKPIAEKPVREKPVREKRASWWSRQESTVPEKPREKPPKVSAQPEKGSWWSKWFSQDEEPQPTVLSKAENAPKPQKPPKPVRQRVARVKSPVEEQRPLLFVNRGEKQPEEPMRMVVHQQLPAPEVTAPPAMHKPTPIVSQPLKPAVPHLIASAQPPQIAPPAARPSPLAVDSTVPLPVSPAQWPRQEHRPVPSPLSFGYDETQPTLPANRPLSFQHHSPAPVPIAMSPAQAQAVPQPGYIVPPRTAHAVVQPSALQVTRTLPNNQAAAPKPPGPPVAAIPAPQAVAPAIRIAVAPPAAAPLAPVAPAAPEHVSFSSPPLINNRSLLSVAKNAPPPKKPVEKPIEGDAWTQRLKFLSEHGTSSLKPGEAFMFSEESGEAVLFQSGGPTIRRIVAAPQDPEEVARLRRPDILLPQELMYNLSLLGKLLPHQEPEQQKQQPSDNFSINDLLPQTEGFFSWLRDRLPF